jgi:FlaG/FlaF family flagellin (archaellin)
VTDRWGGVVPGLARVKRALSSVIGVALILVIVMLLASVVAGLVFQFDDKLQEPDFSEEVNPWSDQSALLAPEDPTAGAEDIRYRVIFEINDSNMAGDSLNEVKISVDGVNESMFSGVGDEDIGQFEVEKTNGTVFDITNDVQDESNWAFAKGDSEVEMVLGGSGFTNPNVGDVITIIFGGVDNPNAPGTYDISVTLNQGVDDQSGTLEIIDP